MGQCHSETETELAMKERDRCCKIRKPSYQLSPTHWVLEYPGWCCHLLKNNNKPYTLWAVSLSTQEVFFAPLKDVEGGWNKAPLYFADIGYVSDKSFLWGLNNEFETHRNPNHIIVYSHWQGQGFPRSACYWDLKKKIDDIDPRVDFFNLPPPPYEESSAPPYENHGRPSPKSI